MEGMHGGGAAALLEALSSPERAGPGSQTTWTAASLGVPTAVKRPRGMKRRRPASLCQRLRLPWPFSGAATRAGTDVTCLDQGGARRLRRYLAARAGIGTLE
jgi:hypothetical protein